MSIGKWTESWAQEKGLSCQFEQETDSTNRLAHEQAVAQGVQTCLFLADHQSQGKGRGPHSWTDVPGTALLSTWCFELNNPPQHLTSPLLGLALFRACSTTWPDKPWSLKAPNDLFLNEKKVGGLLIESVTTAGNSTHKGSALLLIGLGINVRQAPALPEATSLESEFSNSVNEENWRQFLDNFWTFLQEALDSVGHKQLSPQQQQQLQMALNAHPEVEVKKVTAEGSLETAEGQVDWHNL